MNEAHANDQAGLVTPDQPGHGFGTRRQSRRAAQQRDAMASPEVEKNLVASLAAIAGELAVVEDMHGFIKSAYIALAGATVLSSWALIQVMFALH